MTDYIEEIEEQDDDTGQLYEHLRIVVDKGQVPVRIDRFMTERLQHSSRNRIQKAADSGFVHVNEKRSSMLWLGICATCLRSTLTTLKWGWFTV